MVETLLYDDLVAEVLLALVSGIGPRHRQQLIQQFGSPAAVLAAGKDALQTVDGIGPKLAGRIAAARAEIDAEGELRLAATHGLDVLTETHDEYPRLLREIPDPPGVLFRRGTFLPPDNLAIAIVGTRHATRYGLAQAERLAGCLARAGFTIVSGLARGIDASAHRGALAAGGRTIGVLASGLLAIYPPEHKELAAEIADHGCLLSEAPPRMVPIAGAFPQRNRIISGMSVGTIVVEAAQRSGALITARHAYEQGREVFAVPGPIDSRLSRGCHALIKDGVKLIESIDDVLDELGPLVEDVPRGDGTKLRAPAELTLNDIEQQVLAVIETAPTTVDTITSASGLAVHRVLATLNVLETRHLVRRVSGTQVVRA
jgi:DNA processing protein